MEEPVRQVIFEDIIDRIKDIGHIDFSLYQDKMMIFEMVRQSASRNERNAPPPLKIEAFCILLFEKGEGVINIDYRPFRVGANMAVFMSERHIVQFVSISEYFRGHCLFISRDFMRNVMKDTQFRISDVSPVSIISNPVVQLEAEEFVLLRDNLERLQRNIHREDHTFRDDLVQNELKNLSLEFRHIVMFRHGKDGKDTKKQKANSREQVVFRFFQLLIEHSRTERDVNFYAGSLCVTPVYLSRLIKRTIGKPAIKVIHEMAVFDAMALLRKPDMTIQDAADAMNFPDRETFSKFFKNNAGE